MISTRTGCDDQTSCTRRTDLLHLLQSKHRLRSSSRRAHGWKFLGAVLILLIQLGAAMQRPPEFQTLEHFFGYLLRDKRKLPEHITHRIFAFAGTDDCETLAREIPQVIRKMRISELKALVKIYRKMG